MARNSTIFHALAVAVVGLGGANPARAAEVEGHAPARRLCLPPAETREEVKVHHLLEPFAVLKSAAAQFKAEALSAKLCRFGDEFVYEIALLHRDGRFVHVIVDAATGKFVETRHARDRTP